MLILALICTVLGLALLIAALATGILPLAWACIGVCVLGFIFLIVDIVKHRKPKNASEEEPAEGTDDSADADTEDAAEEAAEDAIIED
ncbi:MAG: hypothetical protein WAN89_00235 [Lawsonella sp.]